MTLSRERCRGTLQSHNNSGEGIKSYSQCSQRLGQHQHSYDPTQLSSSLASFLSVAKFWTFSEYHRLSWVETLWTGLCYGTETVSRAAIVTVTSAKKDIYSSGVCLFFCLSVSRITQQVLTNFNEMLLEGRNWLDFGCDHVTLRLWLGLRLSWRRFALSGWFLSIDAISWQLNTQGRSQGVARVATATPNPL